MNASLIHAIAGAVGGFVSMQLLYPLDQVRHAQQTGSVKGFGTLGKLNYLFNPHLSQHRQCRELIQRY
jgi:hypothetical protein